jgi:hypothetical protein
MPNKNLLPGAILLFILSSCGPLVPLSYDQKIPNNTLLQTVETEEATVYLQYLRSQYGYYIFDLEVVNHSESEIFIAPQFVSFYASPKSFKAIDNSNDDVDFISASNSALAMKRQFANSPETTRKIYHDKAKSKASGAVLIGFLGTALTIYAEVKAGEVSRKEIWTKKDVNNTIYRDLLANVAVIASDVAKASAEQADQDNNNVPFELFPESNIQAGASVRGKIYIPIESSYRYSRIVIPLSETDFVFDFKRKGVKPTQSQLQHHL